MENFQTPSNKLMLGQEALRTKAPFIIATDKQASGFNFEVVFLISCCQPSVGYSRKERFTTDLLNDLLRSALWYITILNGVRLTEPI